MKLALTLAAALTLPAAAHAAVSGFHDSAAQIATLLQSEAVADALHQMPVTQIELERTLPDGVLVWEVEGPGCSVDVRLKPLPPQGPGRTTYEIAGIGPCD